MILYHHCIAHTAPTWIILAGMEWGHARKELTADLPPVKAQHLIHFGFCMMICSPVDDRNGSTEHCMIPLSENI